jgi:hypothetical protein
MPLVILPWCSLDSGKMLVGWRAWSVVDVGHGRLRLGSPDLWRLIEHAAQGEELFAESPVVMWEPGQETVARVW